MRDLTQGSVLRHIVAMALPIGASILVQTLYYLVDIYFVAGLGAVALAGVSAAGNAMFVIIGLSQMLSVGAVTLIAHAVGRKERAQANLVFNQAMSLAVLCGTATFLGIMLLAPAYLQSLSDDPEVVAAGVAYLRWFAPGMALQYALVVMGAALRGTGVVKPAMLAQMFTVLVNIVLAPVLIAGWGTGWPLGAAGAGLASTLAVFAGVVLITRYFLKLERYVGFDAKLFRLRASVCKSLLAIGVPAGGEFLFLFVFIAVIYFVVNPFGAAAQAGFGLGSRIMQSIFLPAMAISFALPAIAGQNFGAGRVQRVRDSWRVALRLEVAIMLLLTLVCQISPEWLIACFSDEAPVVAVGAQFLRIISWNFAAMGVVFASSGMFQALGNTWPGLFSMGLRLLTFALPSLWLAQRPGFELVEVWYVSVASVLLQAVTSYGLVRRELARRLPAQTAGHGASAP
ncbi:MAG: MATE family efflux transporter [Betaproteobacteria bacterium]|nr:MATE family efflux transporter [Betaproteobacteria bacterium]